FCYAKYVLVLDQAPPAEPLRKRNQHRLRDPGEEADVPQETQEIGGRPHRSRPTRLGGHATEERVAELVPALTGGRLGEPRERLENRRALVGGELVIRQQGVRGSLQRDEEVRIDHRPAHQVPQPLRHLAGDHTNFIVTLIGSPHAPPSGRRGRASIPDTPWGAMTPAPTDADRRRLLQPRSGSPRSTVRPSRRGSGRGAGSGSSPR